MNIKYELKQSNYKDLILSEVDLIKEKEKLISVNIIISIVIFLIPILALERVSYVNLIFLIVSILFYVLFPKLIYKLKNKNRFNWTLYPGFDKNFIEKCSLSISNKDLTFFNNWSIIKLGWNQLAKVEVVDSLICLEFINNKIIVPLSAFKDEKEKEDFLDIIKMYKVIIGGNNGE